MYRTNVVPFISPAAVEIFLPSECERADHSHLVVKINEDAFSGDIRRGRHVLVCVGQTSSSSLSAVKVAGVGTIIRAVVKDGKKLILQCTDQNLSGKAYEPEEAEIVGTVKRIYTDLKKGEYWELTSDRLQEVARLILPEFHDAPALDRKYLKKVRD